jgi:hypothetical protein
MQSKKALLYAAALTATLVAMPGAQAAEEKMKADTNKDGMVSKDEFMKHAEAMFDKTKKKMMNADDYSTFLKQLMSDGG